MNPKNFTPKYFISVGKTNAYFTLRQTYLHTRYIPSEGPMGNSVVNGVYQGSVVHEVRSFHIQNLAQDAQEAFDKATQFSHQHGTPLDSTLESIQYEMREIKRATTEQLAERAAKLAENDAKQKEWEEEQAKIFQDALDKGVYPFGAHYAKPFNKAPRSYITWLVNGIDGFEENSNIRKVAEAVKNACSELVLPEPTKTGTTGTVGKREVFEVVVIRVAGYQTMYGWSNVVTMIEKATNACMVSKGAFYAEVGESLKIKATVKEYSVYKDQQQTVVQRVAVQ